MGILDKITNLFKSNDNPKCNQGNCKKNLTKADLFAIMSKIGKEKGVDPTLLMAIANIESGLNPKAKATTSSATGLFQFIDSTWLSLLKLYGQKNNILEGNLELRLDPSCSTLMMCELIKENERYLNQKGLKMLKKTDLYLAHFMGPKKAMQFIAQVRVNGSIKGVTMFSQEAQSNPGVFKHKDGSFRSLQEIYDLFTEKLKDYGV